MLSSKMLAGLLAGGLGILLDIVLVTAFLRTPLASRLIEVILLLGLGVLSGTLAARWLEPDDYGREQSIGAFAGLIAAWTVEVGDIILRVITNAVHKPNFTDQLYAALTAPLRAGGAVAWILFAVINTLIYVLYMVVLAGISGAMAGMLGRRKSRKALEALAKRRELQEKWLQETADEPLDPALVPYQRRDYSPFVESAPPPLPPGSGGAWSWKANLMRARCLPRSPRSPRSIFQSIR